ncbi:MAG: hypothetical protein AAGA48_33835 [Myxococcota bacterium]
MPNANGWYQFGGPVDADVLNDRFPGLAPSAVVEGDRVTISQERKDYLALIEEVDELRTDAVAGAIAVTDPHGLVVRLPARWIPPRFEADSVPQTAKARVGAIDGTVGAPILALGWSSDGSLLATAHEISELAVATIWRVEDDVLVRVHEIPVGERWMGGHSLGFAARALATFTNVGPGDGVGEIRLFHADGGQLLRVKTFDKPFRCAAAAPDGFGLVVQLAEERQLTILDAMLEPQDTRAVHADYTSLRFGLRGRLLAHGPEGIDVMDLKQSAGLDRFEGTFTHGVALEEGLIAARTDEGNVLVLKAGAEPIEAEPLSGVRAIGATGNVIVAWGDGELIRFDTETGTVRSRHSVASTAPQMVAVARSGDAVAWCDGQRVFLPSSTDAEAPFDGLVAGGARAIRHLDDDRVWLGDPVDASVDGFVLDAKAWIAPTVDASVVVVAEAVGGGRPTERGLTRVTYRTTDETLGCTYLSDARTADLTPDAAHLVVEIDGNFALYGAVGGQFRGQLGPAVEQLAFALRAPVALSRTRDDLAICEMVPDPPAPTRLAEPEVELAALAEDGSLVVAVGARLALWEGKEAQLRWARGDWSADHVAVSPDRTRIVLTVGGGIHWFSAADGRLMESFAGHPHGVRQLAFRADGSLVTLGTEGTIVHWKARGEGRPAAPDAAEVLRAAFDERDRAMRAPWAPVSPHEPTEVAPLPPLLAAMFPPDPTAGVRVVGALTYFGESVRDEAVLAYVEATGREATTDLQVDDRSLRLDLTLDREVALQPLHDGLLVLARRALRGEVQVQDPRRISHFTYEAGMTEAPAPRYEVVPGSRARLSRLRAPHWQIRPQIEEQGGWLWWLGPYDPEPGERPGPVAPVQRLRVIDQATGQQIWSQLLTFEGVLWVAPDGRLALLTAEDPVEALEEQVGLKLLDPSNNQVLELIEGDRQFARQVQWAPDGAAFGFVAEGEDTHVEVWERDGPRRFWFPLRAWTFRSADELVAAGGGELAFIDVVSGGVTRTLPWPREDHQLIAFGEGFVAIGAEGIAIVDSEGTIDRGLADLRLEEGAVLTEEDGEAVLEGPRGERIRLSDGQPLSAPGYIESAAIAGPWVATWHGEELLVRRWATGEVRVRERLDVDAQWVGQPSFAWAGESLIVGVDDRIRCLDPDGTWRMSDRVGLVAVVTGPPGEVQTAHRDGLVRRYDVATGTVTIESRLEWPIEAFAGHREVTHALFRTGSVVRHVVLETGEELDRVDDVPVGARLALSPNGRSFAVAIGDRVILGGGGFERRQVDVVARSLVFLQDGQRLAIGGDDDLVHIVRVSTGEHEGKLVGHHGYVEVLDTDGTTMVSGAVDGLVWSLDGLELMGFGHNVFLDAQS